MREQDNIVSIIDDTRSIRAIYLQDEMYSVGNDGKKLDKIVAYHENGQFAPVVWFAVYSGEKLVCRVNGAFVLEVYYQEDL